HEPVKTAFETARVADGDEQDYIVRLRRSAGYMPELALVVEHGGELIAHITLTRIEVATSAEPQPALLLAPLCVVRARRCQGIGARLVDEALGRARALGHAAVFVLGDPAYYGRFGFQPSVVF